MAALPPVPRCSAVGADDQAEKGHHVGTRDGALRPAHACLAAIPLPHGCQGACAADNSGLPVAATAPPRPARAAPPCSWQDVYEYHPVSTFLDLEPLRQMHPLVELHEYLAAADGKVDALFALRRGMPAVKTEGDWVDGECNAKDGTADGVHDAEMACAVRHAWRIESAGCTRPPHTRVRHGHQHSTLVARVLALPTPVRAGRSARRGDVLDARRLWR